MKFTEHIRHWPEKVKKRLMAAGILVCTLATFAVPLFNDGFSVLKEPEITSSAITLDSSPISMVAATAFGEARRNADVSGSEVKEIFINNLAVMVPSRKWMNFGLFIGARDLGSASGLSSIQDPATVSAAEIASYGNSELAGAYNKYKAFGFAVQNLNARAKKSSNATVSIDKGLDSMSMAAIKFANLGVKFLNDYNPGPVVISFYDSSNLSTYSTNKLVQIITGNDILKNVVCLFGDKVGATGFSFFVLLNGVIAIAGLGASMLIVLLGGDTVGSSIRKFIIRVIIGSVGLYAVGNLLSWSVKWINETVMNVDSSTTANYVEQNLNFFDWYATGFQLPRDVTLEIDETGNFVFNPENVRAINKYTFEYLEGSSPSDEQLQKRMEFYTQINNVGTVQFVAPSEGTDGHGEWGSDAFYAIMKNFAENNENLVDDGGNDESPLHGMTDFSIYKSKYFWMSQLTMDQNGDRWNVKSTGSKSFYGMNPISAYNLMRTNFSGESISATNTVYPTIGVVAFNCVNDAATAASGSRNMNAVTRFIACFTLTLAALKGLVTIFTAGFSGLISGSVKTATGSSYGVGQALGAVIAMVGGILGISLIMAVTISLLDVLYGMAKELVGDIEVVQAFLAPIQEGIGDVPVIGPFVMGICKKMVDLIMTLVLMLTFPKLGGIPITIFAQAMADLPGHIAERAQMIESRLMAGGPAGRGGGPMPRHGGGNYGASAKQMAGNAFSSGMRQALGVAGSLAAAGKAIGGFGLSAAGRALNNKADSIGSGGDGGSSSEGSGSEESLDTGTETTEEPTTETELPTNEAENPTSTETPTELDPVENGNGEDGVMEETEGLGEGDGDDLEGTDGDGLTEDGPPVPEADPADGLNQTEEEAAAAAAAAAAGDGDGEEQSVSSSEEPSGTTGEPLEEGAPAPAEKSADDSVAHESGTTETAPSRQETGSGQEPSGGNGKEGGPGTEAKEGSTLNVQEGGKSGDVHQHLENKAKVDSKAEVKNVDASKQVSEEKSATLDGKPEKEGTPELSNAAGSLHASPEMEKGTEGGKEKSSVGGAGEGGKSGKGGHASKDSKSTGAKSLSGNGGKSSSAPSQKSGAPAGKGLSGQTTTAGGKTGTPGNSTTVNNTKQGDSKTMQTSNASSTTNATGGQKTVNTSASQTTKTGDATKGGMMQNVRQARTGQGENNKTMNDKGKQGPVSKDGRTLKQQNQARFLHAVGDGLQMMGGNRTAGSAISEALGYMKDAATDFVVPDEIRNSQTMNATRMRRMERMQKQNQRNQRNNKQ